MFRYTFFFVVLISILFSQPALAQKKAKVVVEKPAVSYFYDGGKGEFEFPWLEENNLTVWTNKHADGSKFGLGGTIYSGTKVVFLNPEIKNESVNFFRFINGKTVSITGKFRREGVGEASKIYCEVLYIAVLKW